MGAAQNEGTIVDLQLDHPYLRNCKTKTTANGVQILATVPSQSGVYKKWKEQLQDLSSSIQTQYLLLPQTHRFEEGGICSTTGELHLQYENYPRLLSTEIQSRKKQERKFTEGQLWYLLYVITMSKHQLAQRGQTLGDLHPRNIFLNQRGDIKLTCLTSWPSQLSNYRRAVLDQDYGYLAPQDIQRLKLGAMDNKNNTEAEIFTIGLVLLSCGSLTTHQDLYDMREREFQEAVFFAKVSRFQKDRTYSEIFRAVVSNLLEIEPIKRMTLFELKSFLTKHTENIIAKRPLFIDNVGKKLQFTINQMLNVVKMDASQQKLVQNQKIQGNIPQKVEIVKNNSQIPIPSPPLNNHDKIIGFINYQEKKPSQFHIPPSPVYVGKNEINNHIPHVYPAKGYPSQIQTNSMISNNRLPLISEQQPHKPVINKAFSSNLGPVIKKTQSYQIDSPVKYKPFQAITIKNQLPPVRQTVKQTAKQSIYLNFAPQQQEKIILKNDSKLFKPQEKIIQQSNVKQIVVNVQKLTNNEIWQGQQTSIRQLNLLIDTKKQGFFEHGSLINPKYEPQSIQPQSLHREASLSKQEVVEQPEEEEHASYISHPDDPLENQQQSVVQQQSQENMSQVKNQLSQMRKSQLQQRYNQSKNNSSISKAGSFGHQTIKEDINLQATFGVDERHDEKKDKQLKGVQQHLSNQIQVVNLISHNQEKPMAPLVKVWGMNMKINQTQNNPPNQNSVNVKQYQTTQESLSRGSESQHQSSQRQSSNKVQQLSSSPQRKSVEQTINKEYILIQQDSKHVPSLVKDDKQFVRPNTSDKEKQIIRLQQVEHNQQEQDQSEAHDFHTYCETITDGNFEDCWRQIMLFLNDPSDYSALINPKKVRIRILPNRWSLNVGPAIFDIIINKEQGKFLLKNCEESRCKGWMLGGVYKDEQKRHRIWFNSAYYYKNVKIPSKQIIEDCLKTCKQNILKHKKWT